MNYRFNPLALEELKAAGQYYESRRPGLGARFLAEVNTSIQRVLESPNRWWEIQPGFRKHRLHHFPYGLIYHVVNDDLLEIDALAHSSRRPGYWRHREQ